MYCCYLFYPKEQKYLQRFKVPQKKGKEVKSKNLCSIMGEELEESPWNNKKESP